jgi:ribose 5-phosphate isomerase A
VIVADATKQVERLGKFPLPVEVIRFAQALVTKRIAALGADVRLRTNPDGQPFVTDEHNHILDCRFGEIRDPDELSHQLSDMPGVVEHGLFIGMASVVLFARGSEIVELRR